MTPEDRVKDQLARAWTASLDADPETWHESPWAHIILLIGQRLEETDPGWVSTMLNHKLR